MNGWTQPLVAVPETRRSSAEAGGFTPLSLETEFGSGKDERDQGRRIAATPHCAAQGVWSPAPGPSQEPGASQMFVMDFPCAVFDLCDALPENPSAAEGLARNVAGFAASLFSLMSSCRGQRSCLAEVRALRCRFHTGSALPHAGSRMGCAAWGLADHLLPRGWCWSRGVCAVPGNELQHRAMSSSLPPL